MSKQKNAKQTDVAETEHNPITGEIVDEAPVFAIERPDLSKQALAALAAAENADDSAFVTKEADFWKPEKVGEKLTGIYLGVEQASERLKQHLFAVRDENGEAMVKRINSSRVLKKELDRGEVGKLVRITYGGETKTQAGQRLHLFTVGWMA